jgi:hypothetical protein
MWMGVLWMDDGDEHALLAYEPHRIFIVGVVPASLASAAVTLRAAATEAGTGSCELPRCAHCGADLGMPDLDDFDQEWAACASS